MLCPSIKSRFVLSTHVLGRATHGFAIETTKKVKNEDYKPLFY